MNIITCKGIIIIMKSDYKKYNINFARVKDYVSLFFSSFCGLLLIVPTHGLSRFLLLYILLMLLLVRHPIRLHPIWTLSSSSIFTILIALSIGVCKFAGRWEYIIRALLPSLSQYSLLISICLGIILSFFTSYFLTGLTISFIESLVNKKKKNEMHTTANADKDMNKYDIIVCLIMAVAVITICNMCSFLYPTNPWVSPCCYHTVGKSLWSGMIPYRDLYEHKGPLVYALHSLATLISYRSFIGMYFLLIPFAFFFFYYSRRLLRLFTDQPLEPWFPVLCTGVYTLNSYLTGDSVEEMFFPFMIYSIYVAFRYIIKNTPFSRTTCISLGLGIGVIFWTKFVLLPFIVVLFVFLSYMMSKRHHLDNYIFLLKHSLVGFIIVTLPIILFYSLTGALSSMLEVYFHDNLFLYLSAQSINIKYDETASFLFIIFGNIHYSVLFNTPLYIALIIGMLTLWKLDKYCFTLFFSLVLTVLFLIFLKPVVMPYYTLMLGFFAPVATLPFTNISVKLKPFDFIDEKNFRFFLSFVGVFLVLWGSENLKFMNLKKDEFMQFRFAKQIMQSQHPTLMNYHCQDQGVFAVTGILPVNRFYCDFNINPPGKEQDQDIVVDQKLVDYLILENTPIVVPGYSPIDSVLCPVYKRMYYLYKKIE